MKFIFNKEKKFFISDTKIQLSINYNLNSMYIVEKNTYHTRRPFLLNTEAGATSGKYYLAVLVINIKSQGHGKRSWKK